MVIHKSFTAHRARKFHRNKMRLTCVIKCLRVYIYIYLYMEIYIYIYNICIYMYR